MGVQGDSHLLDGRAIAREIGSKLRLENYRGDGWWVAPEEWPIERRLTSACSWLLVLVGLWLGQPLRPLPSLKAVRCSDAAEAEVCQWATGDTWRYRRPAVTINFSMADVATCPRSWWCHALSSICWQVLVTFGSDVLLKTDVRGVHVAVVAPGAERVVCVLSCGDRFLRFPQVMYR